MGFLLGFMLLAFTDMFSISGFSYFEEPINGLNSAGIFKLLIFVRFLGKATCVYSHGPSIAPLPSSSRASHCSDNASNATDMLRPAARKGVILIQSGARLPDARLDEHGTRSKLQLELNKA